MPDGYHHGRQTFPRPGQVVFGIVAVAGFLRKRRMGDWQPKQGRHLATFAHPLIHYRRSLLCLFIR
ncbi:hypothetical protein SGGMMB4_05597 [Sodalis glossinidius str. 'morsitans']|uniref:Uncharacterized protein n=1 Tax=Sodalis glossinidius (strain morsitans) TaxID=343509 RepID=A0A193QP61_SODGM|nr:hypothetical protein SGGMMB4_05597 [Sodalis glossinidius str. 'morsitans']